MPCMNDQNKTCTVIMTSCYDGGDGFVFGIFPFL